MASYTKEPGPLEFPRNSGNWTNVDGTSFTNITLNYNDTLTFTHKDGETVYKYQKPGVWTGPLP